GPPVYWMPEISRPANADESDADREEFAQTERDLGRFLSANAGREPVLYFGDAAFYKGYDLFLDFVARTPSACATHPGRTYDAQNAALFEHDVEALRVRLRNEGRLFETNRYVHAQRLKELFFGAIRLYITTHRLALSSSTVIQAMELGRPVLVPDRGLLGYRVRTHAIGDVYRYGDVNDLKRKAEQLWRTDLTRFEEPAHRLWSRFSDEAIREFFVERLLRRG
ncbi:MAG: glycosyltransferase, partial [Thermoanaerobaculia bacterium]